MKYCTGCSAEYQDTITQCADCGGSELVPLEELRRRGLRLPADNDTRRFVRAGTAEDPLTSEHLVRVLEEANIPVFARSRKDGGVDLASTQMGWWEILVPEEHLPSAVALINEERARMEASSDEAGLAAEAEMDEEQEAQKKPA